MFMAHLPGSAASGYQLGHEGVCNRRPHGHVTQTCNHHSCTQETWHQFDVAIVAVSIAGFVVDLATTATLSFLPLLRVLRVLRIFRLIPKAKGLRSLLQTLLFSLPALANVGSVLFLFFFVYAVIGMNLFGMIKEGNCIDRHANFSNIAMALLTLLRMVTGENWPCLQQDCMVTEECIQVTQVRGRERLQWRGLHGLPSTDCGWV